tara:strand:- start:349 stop:930 length:582 start_codon:yes stop_codon:yes gene_type:complete
MTLKISEPRTFVIENATLRYAKLDNPVSNEYTGDIPQWELQISTTDQATAQHWADNWLLTKLDKNDPTRTTVSLSRKSKRSDGKGGFVDNRPVEIVAADAVTPFTEEIGYDSVGDVIVWQAPYDPKTPTQNGVKSILTAVMVTEHVKASSSATSGFTAKGSAPVKPTDGFTDKSAVHSKVTVDNTQPKTEVPF